MPAAALPPSRPTASEQGCTLVELIVVITIISLLAAAAVLTMGDTGRALRLEAERFAARAKAVQEDAVIHSRATSISLSRSGYSLARSEGGQWREGEHFAWEPGTEAEAAATGTRTTFDPSGAADPLELVLRRDAQRVMIVIGSDGDVRVRR